MQHAEALHVPSYPPASILDTPQLVLDWNAIKADAEASAKPPTHPALR